MFVGRICVIFFLFVVEKVICQESECFIPGVCIQINECPSIMSIINNSTKPLPLSVANMLQKLHCGFEDNNKPKICCTINGSDPVLVNRDFLPDDASDHPNLNLLPVDNCGEFLGDRLSNGNITHLFEFPWMALLRYEEDGKVESLCGGSLISELYVLTAAHCVAKLKSTIRLIEVRLGEYDTSTDIDCQAIGNEAICAPPVQDIPVEEVFAHPMYDKPRYSNDVAVIRLARPADMTPESVRPICLPTTFEIQSTVLKRVLITGWGTTETQRPATILLQALLPIVPNDICQTKYYKRSLLLASSQMCAGGELGVDSCKGDSGGPLTYPAVLDSVRMVQFGIISAGVSVCSNMNDYPGIYVKVGYYMRWILDQMKP